MSGRQAHSDNLRKQIGLTRSTYREICVRSVRNVLAVLRGETPEAGCVFNADAVGRS